MAKDKNEIKEIARNKKAFHDFEIIERIESGIELKGTEVKSAKAGNINLKDGYAFIKNGEVYLKNVHISQYPYGHSTNHDPLRTRKLLLHKHEILKLQSKIKEKGYTIVPLRAYIKNGLIKIELGVCKGKRLYNKREDIKKKDQLQELKRGFKLSTVSGKLK